MIPLYLFIFLVCLLLIHFFLLPGLLHAKNFVTWDAANYNMVRETGYKGNLNAFFPLFPMMWKGLSPGIYGIVAFNALVFLACFRILTGMLKIKGVEILLYLTIPGFIFFYLPYSESLFFAASLLLLAGIRKNSLAMVLAGLFLCSLTRPVIIILLPALIITDLYRTPFKYKILLHIGAYILTAIAGLFLVALIQYHDTGEWFSFFRAQSFWGYKLQFPRLPFTSWSDGMIVRLDGAAFLVGVISGIALLYYLFRYSRSENRPPSVVLFSICYLGGITLFILLFRGGSLFSLNRFIFAVPFIIVAGHYYLSADKTFNLKELAAGFFIILAFWLLFGSYGHIQTFLKFFLLTLYLALVLVIKSDRKMLRHISLAAFILLNFIFQLVLLSRFLSGIWVG